MKNFVFFFSLLFAFFSCKQPHENSGSQMEEEPIPEEVVAPDVPADMPVVDGDWMVFWNDFKNGVVKESKVFVLTLINFPLWGTGALSTKGHTDGLTQEEMNNLYFRVIDEDARQAISRTDATKVDFYQVGPDGYEGSVEQKMGIGLGEKVYTLKVDYIANTGDKLVLDRSTKFFFAKMGTERRYKLSWVEFIH